MKILEDAKQYSGEEGKAEIDKFLPSFRDLMIRSRFPKRDGTPVTQETSDDLVIGYLSRYLRDTFGKEGPIDQVLFADILQGSFRLDTSKISKESLKVLTEGLSKFRENPGVEIANYNLEMEEGDRIDNRNSGMSAMASLLGVSSLIARSESMQFVGPDGQTVPGTFMEYGKGLDLDHDPTLFQHVGDEPFANKGNVMKQMADLQVLDFLCLNVDRHEGNILYQVNEKGELIGIQGIDNDSAFAKRDVLDRDVNSLRVVSESMARKLDKLTPEMIRFSLRGRGLSEKEIERSSERLVKVKEAIRNKDLKVVKDSEFAGLDFKNLKPVGSSNNLFTRVENYITKTVKEAREYGYGFVPLTNEYGIPDLIQINATDRKGTIAGLEDTLKAVSDYVQSKKKKIVTVRGSSGKFDKLLNAAKNAQVLYQDIKWSRDLDKRAMLTEIEATSTLKKAAPVFRELANTAEDYLNYKMKQRKTKSWNDLERAAKNDYERTHIAYAKKMLRFADIYDEHIEGPKNETERKEMMANYDRRELDIRKGDTPAKRKLNVDEGVLNEVKDELARIQNVKGI